MGVRLDPDPLLFAYPDRDYALFYAATVEKAAELQKNLIEAQAIAIRNQVGAMLNGKK